MFVNGFGHCVNFDEKGFEIPKLGYINIAREERRKIKSSMRVRGSSNPT